MSQDNDEQEPLNLLPTHDQTSFKEISRTNTIEEHIDADLEAINLMLSASYFAWGKIKSVNQVPKMVVSTLMLIEKRRQLSLKPTHAAERKNPKAFGYDPLD